MTPSKMIYNGIYDTICVKNFPLSLLTLNSRKLTLLLYNALQLVV